MDWKPKRPSIEEKKPPASSPRGDSGGDLSATPAGVRHRSKCPLAAGGGGPWSLRTRGALVHGLEVVGARLFRRVAALRRLSGQCDGVFVLPCFGGRPTAEGVLARVGGPRRARPSFLAATGRTCVGLASVRRGRWLLVAAGLGLP